MLKNILLLSVVLLSSHALASSVDSTNLYKNTRVPASVDANRVIQNNLPKSDITSSDNNVTMPKITIPKETSKIPEGADKIYMLLKSLNIQGATVLSDSDFRKLYSNKIGKRIALSEIYNIAAMITDMYNKKGYFISKAFVPAQEIHNGAVKIQVIEGYVNNVKVEGNFKESRLVAQIVNMITGSRPLNTSVLNDAVRHLHSLGGMMPKVVMRPAANPMSGAVGMTMVLTKLPATVHATVDNFSSKFVGPVMGAVNFTATNLIFPHHSNSVFLKTSSNARDLRMAVLSMNGPLTVNGLSYSLAANASSSRPGDALKTLYIHGISDGVSFGLNKEFILSKRSHIVIGSSLAVNKAKTRILKGVVVKHDRYRPLELYTNFITAAFGGNNMFSVKYGQGLDIWNSTKKGDVNASKAAAVTNYHKLNLHATHVHELAKDWLFTLSGSLQQTNNILPIAQSFGYGGQAFGRAYDSSEITGDRGAEASLELVYKMPLKNPKFDTDYLVFYDIGKVDDLNVKQKQSAASAGVGMKVKYNNKLSFTATIAQPLTKKQNTPQAGSPRGIRVLVSGGYEF